MGETNSRHVRFGKYVHNYGNKNERQRQTRISKHKYGDNIKTDFKKLG
jgi:hypothetical protein